MHADMLPYPLPPECAGEIDSLDFERRHESSEVRWGPPCPPGHEVWEYSEGDDEPHYVRDCTEKEIAEREAAYEAAMAEWRRTNGLARTRGPIVDECRVKLTDGRYWRLLGNGKDAWVIVEFGHEC